jgi:hypothetical protein
MHSQYERVDSRDEVTNECLAAVTVEIIATLA